MSKHRILPWLAVAAMAFGALTLFAGGRALFGDPQARAAAGNAVPFVLWFNFLAGFVYILAGSCLLWCRVWAVRAAIFLAAATALIAVAFGIHVLSGGVFEMRTVGALTVRLLFWVVVAAVARSALKVRSKP
jgi:hypothetical protein